MTRREFIRRIREQAAELRWKIMMDRLLRQLRQIAAQGHSRPLSPKKQRIGTIMRKKRQRLKTKHRRSCCTVSAKKGV